VFVISILYKLYIASVLHFFFTFVWDIVT